MTAPSAPSGLTLSAQAAEAAEADEEARAQSIAAMEELREKLRTAERRADNSEKEVEVLQSRLEDAHAEQQKLEDRVHEETERVEMLQNEKRDSARQMREMESIYEAERAAMNKEKEEMGNREEEMRDVIQRLKDSLSQKQNGDDDVRDVRGDSRNFRHCEYISVARHSEGEANLDIANNSSPRSTPQLNPNDSQFAPPSSVNRSDSRNNSKLLLNKDRVIEGLRLELAEAQINIAESENMGGTRLQEVERLLLEARMNNARLMEDNESFQLLLQEKTLNGDFVKLNDFGYNTDIDSSPARNNALDALEGRSSSNGLGSLADELSGASLDDDETFRRLEAELKASKEHNKALALYINKIIERLLEHQGFEAILANDNSAPAPKPANTEKDLPPPPPSKDMPPPAQPTQPSILQRAKSVVAGGNRPKPRPMSQMPAAHSALTDPDTAPSIPFNLNRSASVARKARPQSLNAASTQPGAFNVVSQMYKGQNPTSPLNGPQTPRNSSFFAPRETGGNPNAAARAPSQSFGGSGNERPGRQSGFSDSGSMHSTETGATSHTGEVSTPPGSVAGSVRDGSSIKDGIGSSPPRKAPGTTFAGNKPKPLRLVQDAAREEKEEADRVAKEKGGKRGTWYGWAMSAVAQKKKDDEANGGAESGKD